MHTRAPARAAVPAPVTVSVALLGLSLLECQQLHAALNDAAVTGKGRIAFEPTRSPRGADLLVADSDNPEVTAQVRRLGLLGRTVAVGQRPLARVARQLPSPFDAKAVADGLGRLAASCSPRPTSQAGEQVARVLEQLASFKRQVLPEGRADTPSRHEPAGNAR